MHRTETIQVMKAVGWMMDFIFSRFTTFQMQSQSLHNERYGGLDRDKPGAQSSEKTGATCEGRTTKNKIATKIDAIEWFLATDSYIKFDQFVPW